MRNYCHYHGVHQAPGPFEVSASLAEHRRRGQGAVIQGRPRALNGEVCTMRGKKLRPGET